MNKTLKRNFKYFYQPNVSKDLKKFCKSCDVCQRMVKSKMKLCAPVVKPPIIGESFLRVSCDIIGLMSIISKGKNTYLPQ